MVSAFIYSLWILQTLWTHHLLSPPYRPRASAPCRVWRESSAEILVTEAVS
jgi:hypothetical protein